MAVYLAVHPGATAHLPILDFVKKTRESNPERLIAVVLPELVEPHWYEFVLHNLHAARLRAWIFLQRDQRTMVISTRWYLREETAGRDAA